jgi:spermidine synthase
MITLAKVDTEFGPIHVFKRRSTGAISYEQDGCYQSEADSHGVSLASYIHALYGLIQQIAGRKILLIGCGGGTLATLLSRAGYKVTVIDINAASFVIAKQFFAMPEQVRCEIADGKQFLREDSEIYDAIVIDAYQGAHIPIHLQSLKFYSLVRDHLSLRGAIFVNVHLAHAFDRRMNRIADCMSTVFANVRLLDSTHILDRNAILMGGHVSRFECPRMLIAPEVQQDTIAAELAALSFRSWHLDKRGR